VYFCDNFTSFLHFGLLIEAGFVHSCSYQHNSGGAKLRSHSYWYWWYLHSGINQH